MGGVKSISQIRKQRPLVDSNTLHLFVEFLRRELTNRYLGSAAGVLWVFLQPVLKLLIYSFVFSVIFQIRFSEFGEDGFLPFVAVGLWPWLAFSEALQRSVTSVQSSSSLIRKIRFPHEILVFSVVIAVYIVHLAGLLLVFGMLTAMGYTLHVLMIPAMLVYFTLQMMLSVGVGFVLSSFQVFLKDVSQIVSSAMMFLFYLTPILYPLSQVPERYRDYYLFNPMAFFIGRYRELVLEGVWQPHYMDIIAMLVSVSIFFMGYLLFRRCSRRFEEFI